MKKLLIASALVLASVAASAANFVQVEQENVTGRQGAGNSDATYVRAGKDIGNYSLVGRGLYRFARDGNVR